ncbi:MAG: hypothetical protein AB7F99_09465 [Vicinamibacterales bacterium]
MRRIVVLLICIASAVAGCANTDALQEKVDQLEKNQTELREQFRLYVESDALSTAHTKEGKEDVDKAKEALRRYLERHR